MLTLDQRAEISELLEDGLTFREVAARCGVGVGTVHRFAREIDDEATAYLPSEEEIEAECQKIQARWSDEEREDRRVCKSVPFSLCPDLESATALADAGARAPEDEDPDLNTNPDKHVPWPIRNKWNFRNGLHAAFNK